MVPCGHCSGVFFFIGEDMSTEIQEAEQKLMKAQTEQELANAAREMVRAYNRGSSDWTEVGKVLKKLLSKTIDH